MQDFQFWLALLLALSILFPNLFQKSLPSLKAQAKSLIREVTQEVNQSQPQVAPAIPVTPAPTTQGQVPPPPNPQ